MAKVVKKAKSSAGETLGLANNEFACHLYQALLPPDDSSSENLIFSPFSIHSVLGMLSLGARGETKKELRQALKFKKEDDDKTVKGCYGFVIGDLQDDSDPDDVDSEDEDEELILRTANRVYSREGFKLNKSFLASLRETFQADFQQLDFSSPKECREAAELINNWVAGRTGNRIRDLVNADSFGDQTSLVLVNCVYFKGTWVHEFEPRHNYKDDFSVTPTKTVKVDFMHQTTRSIPYAELPEMDAQVLDMPYVGRDMSMRIFLPKAKDGLVKIQKSLGLLRQNGKNLVKEAMSKWAKTNRIYKINLVMPKFKMEATIQNLAQALEKNLGLKRAFSPNDADFGGISAGTVSDPIFISQVIQKAFICVNEQGTEAAAATEAGVREMRGRTPPNMVYVDFFVFHPFYFEIVDHSNNDLILFSGHVHDPSI